MRRKHSHPGPVNPTECVDESSIWEASWDDAESDPSAAGSEDDDVWLSFLKADAVAIALRTLARPPLPLPLLRAPPFPPSVLWPWSESSPAAFPPPLLAESRLG